MLWDVFLEQKFININLLFGKAILDLYGINIMSKNTEQVTVVFDIQTVDEFHKNKQINEFLSRAFRDFAATYNIIDYEVLEEK